MLSCDIGNVDRIAGITHSLVLLLLLHFIIVSRAVESGLKYRYCSQWGLVLGVLETFYTIAGSFCHQSMIKVRSAQWGVVWAAIVNGVFQSLQSLAGLRNTPGFLFVSELDSAVGAAVRAIGPKYASCYCKLLLLFPLSRTSTCTLFSFSSSHCILSSFRLILSAIPLQLDVVR